MMNGVDVLWPIYYRKYSFAGGKLTKNIRQFGQ